MSGSRIETTKEALVLFIQSLPVGCDFAILRFGDSTKYIKAPNGKEFWSYSDESMSVVLKEIDKIQANLGGTDILMPLKQVD